MKKLLVVLGLLLLVPCMALAQGTYYVDYYANNDGPEPNEPDQIIRIINVGTLGTPLTSPTGDICANIYVFDADQEMIACCTLRLTPNELGSAYVGADLTSHPLTSVVPESGVVKVVLVPPPAGGCNPTVSTTTPDASLGVVFGTHLQFPEGGDENNQLAPYFVTETQKAPSTLSAAEEGFLQTACSFTLYLGSKFSGFCNTHASTGQF
ncbi:MAG TPA: hypothetical protein VFI82_12165 [Terriglobales bacterium]|nr:hypothetical protein [Terriglobales bacterium]